MELEPAAEATSTTASSEATTSSSEATTSSAETATTKAPAAEATTAASPAAAGSGNHRRVDAFRFIAEEAFGSAVGDHDPFVRIGVAGLDENIHHGLAAELVQYRIINGLNHDWEGHADEPLRDLFHVSGAVRAELIRSFLPFVVVDDEVVGLGLIRLAVEIGAGEGADRLRDRTLGDIGVRVVQAAAQVVAAVVARVAIALLSVVATEACECDSEARDHAAGEPPLFFREIHGSILEVAVV